MSSKAYRIKTRIQVCSSAMTSIVKHCNAETSSSSGGVRTVLQGYCHESAKRVAELYTSGNKISAWT